MKRNLNQKINIWVKRAVGIYLTAALMIAVPTYADVIPPAPGPTAVVQNPGAAVQNPGAAGPNTTLLNNLRAGGRGKGKIWGVVADA